MAYKNSYGYYDVDLLKVKGKHIAKVVCKRGLDIELSDKVTYGANICEREKNVIMVPKNILECDPLQALRNFRFYVSREAAYVYLVPFNKWHRYIISKDFIYNRLKNFIVNLIEEYRCTNFLVNRYKGIKRDYVSYLSYCYARQMNIQDVPPELRFHIGLMQYSIFGKIKGNSSVLTKSQIQRIERVKSLLDRYKWSFTFDALVKCAEEIFRIISPEYENLNTEIPIYELETSIPNPIIEESGESPSPSTKEKDSKLKEKEYEKKVLEEFAKEYGVDVKISHEESLLLKLIFKMDTELEHLHELKERRDQTVIRLFFNYPLEHIKQPRCDLAYFEKCRKEIAHKIRELTSLLSLILHLHDLDEEAKCGQMLSEGLVYKLLCKDENLFKRLKEVEPDIAWLILTDVSSSMNKEDSIKTTILLTETADRVLSYKDFSLCAFSNKFSVIKDFTERYDKVVRSRIGGMYFGGTTNICESIDTCISRLNMLPNERKVLIVITDSEPNTCHKNLDPHEHTREVIRKGVLSGIYIIGAIIKRRTSIHFPVRFMIKDISEFPLLFVKIYSSLIRD